MDALLQVTNAMQRFSSLAQQWIHRMIPQRPIYATIGVLSLTTVFLSIRTFKKRKPNMIVLAGLIGSGKTLLFHQLRDGSSHQEIAASYRTNEGTFVLHSEKTFKKGKVRPIHLVDVPGHSDLRPVIDVYLLQAAGLIFVVDALHFLPNCHEAAGFLYDILTNESTTKRNIPVLILCNKTDKVTAHTKEFIRKQLEREIDKLCSSATPIATTDYMLSENGASFTFSGCPNEVTVAEGSGLTGEISDVEKFIRDHVLRKVQNDFYI